MTTHFFYPANEPRDRGTPFDYERLMKMDPHPKWAVHAYNEIALRFISQETRDAREKTLAESEILIAQRKQRWWENHPRFDDASADLVLAKNYRVNRKGEKVR